MYIHEQPKEGGDVEEDNHGVEMECKSSKVPTHFTVPQQGEHNRRGHGMKGNRHKNKRTAEDKQYRKLNKQSKRVKTLQDQYRQLQQQIKQLKQMVQMQMQTLTLTMTVDNSNYQNQRNNTLQQGGKISKIEGDNNNKQKDSNNNNKQTATPNKLQQLITTLFSYQQTISTANSNYLLLSQVNKQQQAQSLFHIGNLQERIRQLRFSLNTKQDLLAYQLSTIQNPQQGGLQDQDARPVIIDYHMPKRPTMANFNTVSIDCQSIQKALQQVQSLKSAIVKLQKDLQLIYKQQQQGNNKNNKENQQQESGSMGEYKTIEMSDNEKELGNKSKGQSTTNNSNNNNNNSGNTNNTNNNNGNKNNSNNISPSKRTVSPTKPTAFSQLYYLPLSITHYQNTLIYKAAKLNQLQKQKSQKLKCMYKQLLGEYHDEVDKKKKLVSEYEIQRDIFQYKKKQSLLSTGHNSSKNIIKNNLHQISQESDDDGHSSSRSIISTENILAELKEQLSLHSETDTNNREPSVVVVDRDKMSEQGNNIANNRTVELQQQQLVVVSDIASDVENIQCNTVGNNNKEGNIEEIGKNVDGNNVSKNNSTNTNINANTNTTNIKSPFLKLKLKSSSSSSSISISLPTLKPSQSIQPSFINSSQQQQPKNDNNKQTSSNQSIQFLQTPIISSTQLSQLSKPNSIKDTPIKPKLQLPAYRKDKTLINQSNNSINK